MSDVVTNDPAVALQRLVRRTAFDEAAQPGKVRLASHDGAIGQRVVDLVSVDVEKRIQSKLGGDGRGHTQTIRTYCAICLTRMQNAECRMSKSLSF